MATPSRGFSSLVALLVASAALVCGLLHPVSARLDSHAKCSACEAVAFELSRAVRKEVPSMDIDLRGRLTPSGKRVGKVVDYHMSELRALELTEGLCRNMDDYARVEKDGRTGFTKISNTDGEAITISGGLSLGGDQSNDAKRELKLFCDTLVEEHEESIGVLLQAAQPGEPIPDVKSRVCVDMAAVCSSGMLQGAPDDATQTTGEADEGTERKLGERRREKRKRKRKPKRKRKRKGNGKGGRKRRRQHTTPGPPKRGSEGDEL